MRLLMCLAYVAVLGIAAHFIGEGLPRRWFDPTRGLFAQTKFEKSGKLYRTLRVHRWKDKLPDMSRVSPDMVKKSVSLSARAADVWQVALETCVAEVVHLALMLLSFPLYLIYPCPLGAVIAVAYGLSHIPFIIIQRYNPPTLVTLSERLKRREERMRHAHTDTLGQHR